MSEETKYKTDILYMRLSAKGKHVYMFNEQGQKGTDLLGAGVNSLLINVAELKELLGGDTEWIKVSAMREWSEQDGN